MDWEIVKFYIVVLALAILVGGAFIKHIQRQDREIAALNEQNKAINAAFFASIAAQKATDSILADRENERHEQSEALSQQLQALESAKNQKPVQDWASVRVPSSVLRLCRSSARSGEGGSSHAADSLDDGNSHARDKGRD